MNSTEQTVTTQNQQLFPCPRCHSSRVRRVGHNVTKQYGIRAQLKCKDCELQFTPPTIEKVKNRPACPKCREFMRKSGKPGGAQVWACPTCKLSMTEGKTPSIAQILDRHPHLNEEMYRLEAKYKHDEEERLHRTLQAQEDSAKEALAAWIEKRRSAITKKSQGKATRALAVMEGEVRIEEYDVKHKCITVEEIRWILDHCKRFSPYWMYFVIRITTGMRPEEAVRLTLYDLSPDLTTINYRVDKAATRISRRCEYVRRCKHRAIVLDPWVRSQLIEYLNRTCRAVHVEGRTEYVSPYQGQKLFPWSSMMVVGAYWYKMRQHMKAEGFDAMRMVRESIREVTGHHDRTYVLRPHILRHFSASVMFYKLGKDLASVRDWIKHEDVEITNGYLHSASEMGTTAEFITTAAWPEILGFDDLQQPLPMAQAPEQVSLRQWT